MADDHRFESIRSRVDGLRAKVRLLRDAEADAASPGSVRRCSYCREPGHYRTTCEALKAEVAELKAANDALERELAEAHEEAAQARADRQWWIDKAFELQDEIREIRRQLNSVAVYAKPTRGR